MKASGIVALSLLGLAAAAPYKHMQHGKGKRDIVWVTETAEVVETVLQTTTVWVDPTEEAQEYTPTPTPEPATVEETTSTTPTPEPTTSSTPAPEPTTSSTPAYTPPAPTTTSTTPTSTYTPPPATTQAPSSTSTYVAPTSSAAPASSAVVAAESSTGETFSPSRITYYSPSVGLGSCGETYSDDSNVVALAAGNMNSGLCNKKLTIEVNGKTFGAFVGDTCPGCPSDGSLDITPTLFTKMMGSTDAGVITDAKWWWDE